MKKSGHCDCLYPFTVQYIFPKDFSLKEEERSPIFICKAIPCFQPLYVTHYPFSFRYINETFLLSYSTPTCLQRNFSCELPCFMRILQFELAQKCQWLYFAQSPVSKPQRHGNELLYFGGQIDTAISSGYLLGTLLQEQNILNSPPCPSFCSAFLRNRVNSCNNTWRILGSCKTQMPGSVMYFSCRSHGVFCWLLECLYCCLSGL